MSLTSDAPASLALGALGEGELAKNVPDVIEVASSVREPTSDA